MILLRLLVYRGYNVDRYYEKVVKGQFLDDCVTKLRDAVVNEIKGAWPTAEREHIADDIISRLERGKYDMRGRAHNYTTENGELVSFYQITMWEMYNEPVPDISSLLGMAE